MVFWIVIIVGGLILLVFMVDSNRSHEDVQKEIAVNMYGGMPAVTSGIEEPKPGLSATLELLRQATIMEDAETIGDINNNTYEGKLPERRSDGGWLSVYDDLRILGIAGINHRQRIGSYMGRVDVALVPEPTNEFDPCAIKVGPRMVTTLAMCTTTKPRWCVRGPKTTSPNLPWHLSTKKKMKLMATSILWAIYT